MAYLALVVEDVVINKWEITDNEMIIGRVKYCDVHIEDRSVSSRHATIIVAPDPFLKDSKVTYLVDLESTNGTEVNGKRITKQQLNDGDMIKIGFNQFRFSDSSALNLDETAVIVPPEESV